VRNLFICLYLDEDVNVLIAELLQARGFDVITARNAEQHKQLTQNSLLML
jgi:DNA-binding response OmpR family regulator